MIETRPKKGQERVAPDWLEKNGVSKWAWRDSLDELRELAEFGSAKVVDTITQSCETDRSILHRSRQSGSIRESCRDQQ